MSNPGEKICVGLSGGVDSSVAALLLKQQGYEVIGVFLRCVNLDGCADQDAEDARRVAEHLGISFYSWDFEERYREAVVNPLISGYAHGLTPNPDVACNKEIKFGAFLDAAKSLGVGRIATGHYARSITRDGQVYIAAAADTQKDQSYFLALLSREQAASAVFSLGDMTKPEVRLLARKAGLPTATKKDSQGICFLGKVSLSDYLKTQLPMREGEVLDAVGTVIGTHSGAAFLTVGQRSGFRITKKLGSHDTPIYYVAERDVIRNTITVVEAGDERLLIQGVGIDDAVTSLDPSNSYKVFVRTRYRQPVREAMLSYTTRWEIMFSSPHDIAALGQIAACYDQEGAIILAGPIAKTL